MEETSSLPFPTISLNKEQYRLHGLVTDLDWEGSDVINWLYQRCGKSEEAHAVMKDDLSGGVFPSGGFGENAAWWWIMILATSPPYLLERGRGARMRFADATSQVTIILKCIRDGYYPDGSFSNEHFVEML